MRCCPISLQNKAVCMEPVYVDSRPTVTVIIVGFIAGATPHESGVAPTMVVGSSTLVQSGGINILVDTSSMRSNLLSFLWETSGLVLQDINMVVETRGYWDHVVNVDMFANVDHVNGVYLYNGPVMTPNPLASGQRYYLFEDLNVEVIQTPGHTPSDLSVIVRNVPGFGVVSIVGDLIQSQNDMSDSLAVNVTQAKENRKKLICISDYIVPGHGEMFHVDETLKTQFKC